MGRRDENARERWLTRFFSSTSSSAIVLSVPATTNSGSYPKPPEPRGVRVIVPSHVPSTVRGSPPPVKGSTRASAHRKRAPNARGLPESVERREERGVVLGVGGAIVGKARAPDAWASVERVHLEAGVV